MSLDSAPVEPHVDMAVRSPMAAATANHRNSPVRNPLSNGIEVSRPATSKNLDVVAMDTAAVMLPKTPNKIFMDSAPSKTSTDAVATMSMHSKHEEVLPSARVSKSETLPPQVCSSRLLTAAKMFVHSTCGNFTINHPHH